MAKYIRGADLGSRIATKLGIEPSKVQSMTLRIAPDDVVRLEVIVLPSEEDLEEIHNYILIETT